MADEGTQDSSSEDILQGTEPGASRNSMLLATDSYEDIAQYLQDISPDDTSGNALNKRLASVKINENRDGEALAVSDETVKEIAHETQIVEDASESRDQNFSNGKSSDTGEGINSEESTSCGDLSPVSHLTLSKPPFL